MSLLMVSAGEKIFDLVVLRKKYLVLRWLSDFELKKYSLGNLTKRFFFQSSLGLILLNWGLAEDCVPAYSFCRRKNFCSGCTTKKVLST